MNYKLVATVMVGAAFVGCRTTRTDSNTKETTPFSSDNVVDLTRYDQADDATFKKMKEEMKAQNFDYAKLRQRIDNLSNIPSGVEKDELVAIRLYTSSAYKKVNQALRTRDPSALPAMEAIIKTASSGLNKLPSSPCSAKRGTSLPDDVLKALDKDVQFIDCAFMSTTYGDIPAAFRKDITFEIESDKCTKIDWMSEFPNEKEVLFPPGSEFYVTDKKVTQSGSKTLTTFKMKHIMSGDPELANAVRKIDCKNITDLPRATSNGGPSAMLTAGAVGSPGTTGVTKVDVASLVGRTFASESTTLKVRFDSNGKAEHRLGAQRSTCNWSYADNKFTVKCPAKTHYFFAFSSDRIGAMLSESSDQISEYLKDLP